MVKREKREMLGGEGGREGRQAGWPATTRSESQLAAAAAAFLFRHLSYLLTT